jgi:hypothetical protein
VSGKNKVGIKFGCVGSDTSRLNVVNSRMGTGENTDERGGGGWGGCPKTSFDRL